MFQGAFGGWRRPKFQSISSPKVNFQSPRLAKLGGCRVGIYLNLSTKSSTRFLPSSQLQLATLVWVTIYKTAPEIFPTTSIAPVTDMKSLNEYKTNISMPAKNEKMVKDEVFNDSTTSDNMDTDHDELFVTDNTDT